MSATANQPAIQAILAKLAAGEIGMPEATAKLEALKTVTIGAQVKKFKVSADSPKGVFTITLPGMGMPIAPPVEALQALVDNVDALRAALKKHGAERKATREVYKQTPAYKASAKQMFDVATAAKREREAA